MIKLTRKTIDDIYVAIIGSHFSGIVHEEFIILESFADKFRWRVVFEGDKQKWEAVHGF